jgi:hypothetical protein
MTGRARPLEPPFLLTAVTSRRGLGVAVTGDASTAVLEMAVHGEWSPRLGDQVSAGLRLCLAGPSASIILDLRHVDDPYGISMPFWLAAWREARLEPSPVHLAFCLPAVAALSRRLRNLKGPQPRVFTTVSEARVAIAGRLSRTDRLQVRLAPEPASVKAARDLAAKACQAWRLAHLGPATSIVVSELATNAVEHAGTDFVVTVSRAGRRLHVAVHDGAPRFPRPNGPALTDPAAVFPAGGRGLMLVHKLATGWGSMPARGGKVVWATIT